MKGVTLWYVTGEQIVERCREYKEECGFPESHLESIRQRLTDEADLTQAVILQCGPGRGLVTGAYFGKCFDVVFASRALTALGRPRGTDCIVWNGDWQGPGELLQQTVATTGMRVSR